MAQAGAGARTAPPAADRQEGQGAGGLAEPVGDDPGLVPNGGLSQLTSRRPRHRPNVGDVGHPRDPAGHCVQRRQIGLACYLGITHKAPHRLDRTVQRFAQLVKHPSQRTQVLISLGPVGGRCIVDINR